MTKLEARNSKLEATPAAAIAPVRDFKAPDAWKLARNLPVLTFVLLKKLPAEERFARNSQIRRAVQSQFCRQARGSAYEVRDQLVSALDANLISSAQCEEADGLAQRVIQTLNGYIRFTSKRPAESRKDR
jgi:hypothetical protein